MKKFGGSWTIKKLDAFINYVKAYAKVLNSVKQKYNWKTIYFDGFAGYGERKIEVDAGYSTLECFPDENDYNLYQGSVTRILNLPNEFSFDYYYFIDKNKDYIAKLEQIKETLEPSLKDKVTIRNDDCNNQLTLMAQAIKSSKRYAALVFLDPFGMQINWESISQLKNTRSDVWILVPSGVAINRLLDKKMKLKQIDKLERFFGLPKERIEEIFYRQGTKSSLFGEDKTIEKVQDPISKIIEIYIQQLKTVWKHVTPQPLQLTNSKNCTIFHFIFATNNSTGLKIASDILKSN